MPLEVVRRNYFICEQHFEKKWFKKSEWKASLNYFKNPVPTIFRDNYNDFAPEVLQDAYEVKKKREAFMCKFPDYESQKSDEEMEENEFKDAELATELKDTCEFNQQEGTQTPEVLEVAFVYEDEPKPLPCRFCTFPVGDKGMYIFSDEEESKKIQKMVNVVLPAQVRQDDGLPHHMCLMCIEKLKHCYETVLAYFAAEAFFRSQIDKNVEPLDSNDESDRQLFNEESEDCLQFGPDHLTNGYSVNSKEKDEMTSIEKGKQVSLKCGLCFVSCPSIKDLVFHRKMRHHPALLMKKRFFCMKCPMIFIKAKTLKAHMRSSHMPVENDFPCDDCDRVFNSKHLLKNHRKQMHKKYACKECGESFYYPVLFKRHMRIHDINTNCAVCNKEFKNIHLRRVHEQTHSEEGVDLCWLCGKVFYSKANLQSHLLTHSQKFTCEVCGKTVTSLHGLRKHKSLHKDREKYKCEVCSKTFFSKKLLNQHNITHREVRSFVCHCGASFNRLSNLNYHKKRHLEIYANEPKSPEQTDSEIYKCHLCSKQITSKMTYKYHMARHTGNKKPFDCEECGLAFSTTYSYKTHVRIHTGERPFVCNVPNCGLGFRSKNTLQQHELVHLDDRPFACPFCPVTFKRLYSLNMHKTTHSASRPFQCTVCGRAFARKPDARIHVMRQHSISNNDVYDYLQEVVSDEEILENPDTVDSPCVVEEELSNDLIETVFEEDIGAESVITESVESCEQSSFMYDVIMP